MKIYFAGVPGGNQLEREREIFSKYRWNRLLSYYYFALDDSVSFLFLELLIEDILSNSNTDK